MHKLRCIIAVMLAIFIAGPACCCLGMVQPVTQAEHSCCGGEKEQKESACNCTTAKHQKLADKDVSLPAVLDLALPPQPGTPILAPLVEEVITPSPAWAIDTGPPPLQLEELQRFLI